MSQDPNPQGQNQALIERNQRLKEEADRQAKAKLGKGNKFYFHSSHANISIIDDKGAKVAFRNHYFATNNAEQAQYIRDNYVSKRNSTAGIEEVNESHHNESKRLREANPQVPGSGNLSIEPLPDQGQEYTFVGPIPSTDPGPSQGLNGVVSQPITANPPILRSPTLPGEVAAREHAERAGLTQAQIQDNQARADKPKFNFSSAPAGTDGQEIAKAEAAANAEKTAAQQQQNQENK